VTVSITASKRPPSGGRVVVDAAPSVVGEAPEPDPEPDPDPDPEPEPDPEQPASNRTSATSAETERCTAANGTLAAMGGSCDSCGREEDELFAVHRKYVIPERWDTPGSERVLDEVERWCFPCLTSYPHVLVDG
jgi:hypothetical protein